MNIIIAINEGYIEPAKTMLFSLSCQHGEHFRVYLLYSRISECKLQEFAAWVEQRCHAEFRPVKISPELFKNAPRQKWWTEEMYYRLVAFDILPEDVDRALWLDADIIVNGNIDAFYNQSFDNTYAVVCKGSNQAMKHSLDLPDSHIYFSSGVILFNFQKIRTDFTVSFIFSCIETHHQYLKAPDQDILNILFHDCVKYADERIYNCETFGFSVISREDLSILKNCSKIIHFTGRIKPWKPGGANWADTLWWKYELKRGRILEYFRYRIQSLPHKGYYIGRELYYMFTAQFRKIITFIRRKDK